MGGGMKTKLLGLIILMALLGVGRASASAITYRIDIVAGTQSIVGTITTDGTIGTLLLSNITNWDLVGYQTGGANVTMLGPSSGSNSTAGAPSGSTGLVATATTLSFLFESTNVNIISFHGGVDSDSPHGGYLGLYDAGDTFTNPVGPSVDVEVNSGPSPTSPATDLIGSAIQTQGQSIRTYVSITGSDSNPCSLTAPCRHFQAALNATAVGGEVDSLDPGGYGSVIISQAVTIDGEGWSYVAPPTDAAAITITANAGDKIYLRGLSLNGIGVAGSTGILFSSGSILTIQGTQIRNFAGDGIDFFSSTLPSCELSLSTVLVADNGANGINVQPSGSTAATANFDSVDASDNAADGILLSGMNSAGLIAATASSSSATGNGGSGYDVNLNSGTATALSLMLYHYVTANNAGNGLQVIGAGTQIFADGGAVMSNGHGWNISGGVLNSYSDNYVANNGSNTGAPTPVTKE
jgi:hypothetical protein